MSDQSQEPDEGTDPTQVPEDDPSQQSAERTRVEQERKITEQQEEDEDQEDQEDEDEPTTSRA